MPPPSTYIDVNAIPFTRVVTQAEYTAGTFGGVANQVWFRFVNATDLIFGGVTSPGAFRMDVYESTGTTIVFTAIVSWHFHLGPGTYYIKVLDSSGVDFTVAFDTRPALQPADVQAGDFLINDDVNGIISKGVLTTVLTPAGAVRGYLVDHFPSGESAAMLPTGESLWYDTYGTWGNVNSIALFDASLEYVLSLDFPDLFSGTSPRITEDGTQFYLLTLGAKQVWTISKTGAVSAAPIATIPAITNTLPGRTGAIGVSRDGTILYFGFYSGATSGVIYRWDLVNNVALSNLYTIPGWNYAPATDFLGITADINWAEALTMADGRVVTSYYKAADNTSHILILSSAGVLLHDFSYSATNYTLDHLAYVWGNEDHVLAWFHNSANEIGRWDIVDLNTGTLASEFQLDLFENGKNLRSPSTNIWGPSESCVVFVAVAPPPPPPPPPPPEPCELARQSIGCVGSPAPSVSCNTNPTRAINSIETTPATNRLSAGFIG